MNIPKRYRRHLATYGEVVWQCWHLMRDPNTRGVYGRRIIGTHMYGGTPVNDLGETVILFGYMDDRGEWIE